MNEKSIKIQRVQSVLKELIPEALNTLNDELLHNLSVVEVDCSRGKYNANVYLDGTGLDNEERRYILTHLKSANRFIQTYCIQAEGWYRCPVFTFKFDDSLEKQNKMDVLFDKINKELKKSEDDE